MMPTPIRIVAYLRVSTEEQGERGASLDAQREKVVGYAALYGYEVVEVLCETASGKTLDRPLLQRALGLLDSGAAHGLCVAKLDRLTRSVRDLGELLARHFDGRSQLLSVSDHIDTTTAAGRLVLNVLGSVAQWEREIIAERTREVLQHKRAHGQRVSGHVPFGTMLLPDRRSLGPNEAEVAALAAARAAYERGLNLREVGVLLAARSVYPGAPRCPCAKCERLGRGRWHPKTVRDLLRRAGTELRRKSGT